MQNAITTTAPENGVALQPLMARAAQYVALSKAPNTVAAYHSDWRHFAEWCAGHAVAELPARPETVALYATNLADSVKPSTIVRRLAAISKAHQAAGLESPCSMRHAAVAEVLAGIKREKGTAQEGVAPLLTADVRRIVATLPENALGARDAALLLLGFAGGFRRSELVALTVEDLEECSDGLRVRLRRSKTDQEGAGRIVGVPFGSDPATCPVRTLRRWLEASGITSGPLFRNVNRHGRIAAGAITPQVVRLVVRRASEAAGLDSERFGAHSLRAGLATQAAINGASERSIMRQTGHRSVGMVRRYIRDGNVFRENAAARLGL